MFHQLKSKINFDALSSHFDAYFSISASIIRAFKKPSATSDTEADMNWFSATTESADECKDDRLPASFCITDYKVNVYVKSSY